MELVGPLLSLIFIVIVTILLLKKIYPHAVLLFAGILMLSISFFLELEMPNLKSPTGFEGFDLFRYIKESFSKTNAGVGLMIMTIGGFVSYIDKIGASKSLVYLSMKPLSIFKKRPNLMAIFVIPIGQILFVCIPSAAGLGLLLMASIFPILIGLGVSRLSAVSVITACTAFGIGPASAITASATDIAQVDNITYFINYQIPLVLPLTLTLMISYYFTNSFFDKKNSKNEDFKIKKIKLEAPLFYAIIPVLPLVILMLFSELFSIFSVPILLDTTTAMFVSLFIAIIFEFIRHKNIKQVTNSLSFFWEGMGNIFKTVVTLIIAADIFAKGLISLGFITGLLDFVKVIGLGAIGIGIILTVFIFLSSMLMGSGNAAFFAFAPLIPKISSNLGLSSLSYILPMNLAASMGRTVSPISGVLIATSQIAKVSTFEIVKRNIIPFILSLIVLLIIHNL